MEVVVVYGNLPHLKAFQDLIAKNCAAGLLSSTPCQLWQPAVHGNHTMIAKYGNYHSVSLTIESRLIAENGKD